MFDRGAPIHWMGAIFCAPSVPLVEVPVALDAPCLKSHEPAPEPGPSLLIYNAGQMPRAVVCRVWGQG